MSPPWLVTMEVPLIAEVENWHRNARLELFAVLELFRENGPEAFELFAETFADAPDWDSLAEPCGLEFFVRIRGRHLKLRLDVLPGREIVFRAARRA